MHVIATAGHVDHGKSTLVKALTGSEPDRLAEERRRGLSIELGYCWTALPPAGDVAFVDVPGHERFVTTMLAGVGPVSAVLFVVAADDPWMPQAAEHLGVLDALGVTHAVLAVTRSDLADPGPVLARARAELDRTSLRGAPAVTVSGRTGQGLDRLRAALVDMAGSLPAPDPSADVRLWVDRCFHVRGAGTVVTGTLPAGRIAVGDTLALGGSRAAGDGTGAGLLRVRGVQVLGQDVDAATGVARVALNVAGEERGQLERHSVLVTPGAWLLTDVVDVRLSGSGGRHGREEPPERPVLHVGAAAVGVHHRPLGDGLARLTLEQALPLRVGDRALVRDPGSRQVWGATVLDPAPPRLRRRGAAQRRSQELAGVTGTPTAADEVRRRGVVRLSMLERIGVPIGDAERHGATPDGWLLSPERAQRAGSQMLEVVRSHDCEHPLDPGVPVAVLAERLGLPSPQLVAALVRPPLRLLDGRVRGDTAATLPPDLARAVRLVRADLERQPFAAPTADRLREVQLHARAVAAAARAGELLHLGDGIVLLPGADVIAVDRLRALPQPFTTSEARAHLGTTRRVVLPLLQHLDRQGRTRRLPDDRRSVVDHPPSH